MDKYNSVGAGSLPSKGNAKFINGCSQPIASGSGPAIGPAMGATPLGAVAKAAPVPPAPSMGVLPPEVPGRAMKE